MIVMSRNLLLLAGGIVGVLLIATFLMPTTQSDGFNFGFSVIGEDEHGSPVTIPFSWWINGVEISNLRVVADWEAIGSGVDWTSLVIAGAFKIYRLDYQGRNPTDITPADLSFQKMGLEEQTGSVFFSLECGFLIDGVNPSGSDEGSEYWYIQVTLSITGSVEQSGYGEDLTDSFSDTLTFTVKWIDGSFSLQGGLTQ